MDDSEIIPLVIGSRHPFSSSVLVAVLVNTPPRPAMRYVEPFSRTVPPHAGPHPRAEFHTGCQPRMPVAHCPQIIIFSRRERLTIGEKSEMGRTVSLFSFRFPVFRWTRTVHPPSRFLLYGRQAENGARFRDSPCSRRGDEAGGAWVRTWVVCLLTSAATNSRQPSAEAICLPRLRREVRFSA